MAENILYQNGKVTITPSKVMFGGTSYFLRNIASVRVQSATRGGVVLLFALGLIMALASLPNAGTQPGALIVGIVLAVIAGLMGFRRHYLHFDTSSGAINAYHGKRAQMEEIKGKIEDALSASAPA